MGTARGVTPALLARILDRAQDNSIFVSDLASSWRKIRWIGKLSKINDGNKDSRRNVFMIQSNSVPLRPPLVVLSGLWILEQVSLLPVGRSDPRLPSDLWAFFVSFRRESRRQRGPVQGQETGTCNTRVTGVKTKNESTLLLNVHAQRGRGALTDGYSYLCSCCCLHTQNLI